MFMHMNCFLAICVHAINYVILSSCVYYKVNIGPIYSLELMFTKVAYHIINLVSSKGPHSLSSKKSYMVIICPTHMKSEPNSKTLGQVGVSSNIAQNIAHNALSSS